MMEALHNILAYVLGFDPTAERERHNRSARVDAQRNAEKHREFRKKLEEDPLTELLRHLRPTNGDASDDRSDKGTD